MIRVKLTNEILKYITEIEKNRYSVSSVKLSKNGFVVPILVNQRIRSYELSEFTKDHEKEIIKSIRDERKD